jgi:hypothetical protein
MRGVNDAGTVTVHGLPRKRLFDDRKRSRPKPAHCGD